MRSKEASPRVTSTTPAKEPSANSTRRDTGKTHCPLDLLRTGALMRLPSCACIL
ncbi:hypothetical protein D3C72_2291260 [compost metagenome]